MRRMTYSKTERVKELKEGLVWSKMCAKHENCNLNKCKLTATYRCSFHFQRCSTAILLIIGRYAFREFGLKLGIFHSTSLIQRKFSKIVSKHFKELSLYSFSAFKA